MIVCGKDPYCDGHRTLENYGDSTNDTDTDYDSCSLPIKFSSLHSISWNNQNACVTWEKLCDVLLLHVAVMVDECYPSAYASPAI